MKKYLSAPNVLAFAMFLLLMLVAGHYGIFGDELYYIQCAKHLDFGYVDHPPFVALMARLSLLIFGETLLGLRFLAAIAGALTVWLSASIARELGGTKFAQSVAALLIFVGTAFTAIFSFFSMNAFDLVFCTFLFYLLIKITNGASPRTWLLVGLVMGVGLQNKYTILVLGFGLLIGLSLSKERRHLITPWPYLAGTIALLLIIPHLLWQIANDWPTLEFIKNAQQYKNNPLSPLGFFQQLILILNPITLPIWISGLVYFFLPKNSSKYRFLGFTVVVFVLVYLFQRSKVYYVVPVFPLLMASGAILIDKFARRIAKKLIKPAIVTILALAGLVLMPIGVPVLPVKLFVPYARSLGVLEQMRMERSELEMLPIHYAYRFGWPELVEKVAEVFNGLPEEDRSKCGILGSWYGIAGAVDHFGPAHGLPSAICPRNSYWFWGTRGYTGEVMIAVGFGEKGLKEIFHHVERAAYFKHPYAYGQIIFICRDLKEPLENIWRRYKRFI